MYQVVEKMKEVEVTTSESGERIVLALTPT